MKSILPAILALLALAPPAGAADDFATTLQKAEAGSAGAQNNLGLLYKWGRGVPQDDAEAATWFRKAAEQGNEKAKQNLAEIEAQGKFDIVVKKASEPTSANGFDVSAQDKLPSLDIAAAGYRISPEGRTARQDMPVMRHISKARIGGDCRERE